jgi:Uma2 family endonuclease
MENEVKESAPKFNHITPQEYLQMERAAEEKSEYYEGHVYAMSGASLKHNRIAMNLYGEVRNFLKGKNCEILPGDMRVKTPSSNAYMYPDAMIVCDEPDLEDEMFDIAKNPSVIIEILSPSTRSIDKKKKFFFYRQIPSLQEYIMIDSLKKFVHVVSRKANDTWQFEDISEQTGELSIRTIGFKISFDEIYHNTGL